MKTPTDKILTRIRRLLALGNDKGAAENEAEIALRRAHSLLAEYNISVSDLDNDRNGVKYGQEDFTFAQSGPWARRIAFGIARLYFCEYFFTNVSGRKDRHYFIGQPHNRAVAIELSTWVLDIIHKQAVRGAKLGGGTPYRNSFRNSAGTRIQIRCNEMRRTSMEEGIQSESSPGTSLVLTPVYDREEQGAKDWLTKQNIHPRATKSRARSTSSEGSTDGYVAGNKVNLRPVISNKAGRRAAIAHCR